jgi:hypothetical protein
MSDKQDTDTSEGNTLIASGYLGILQTNDRSLKGKSMNC